MPGYSSVSLQSELWIASVFLTSPEFGGNKSVLGSKTQLHLWTAWLLCSSLMGIYGQFHVLGTSHGWYYGSHNFHCYTASWYSEHNKKWIKKQSMKRYVLSEILTDMCHTEAFWKHTFLCVPQPVSWDLSFPRRLIIDAIFMVSQSFPWRGASISMPGLNLFPQTEVIKCHSSLKSEVSFLSVIRYQ